MSKTLIALTMGDPAGIGPEICLLSFNHPKLLNSVNAFIIGDIRRLQTALEILVPLQRLPDSFRLRSISQVEEAKFEMNVMDVLDLNNVPAGLPWGEVRKTAGLAAFQYVEKAAELAVAHQIDALCTAPIHKEAWKLANIPYSGHTEALATLSGSTRFAMMLVNRKLRVVHVTTHVSLAEAIRMATPEKIYERIELTVESLRQLGIAKPNIAVSGINPHAGENGLFGQEDLLKVLPAVQRAQAQGWQVSGPWPPDSVYARAAAGEFDAVIAMYHDQGHIAIKMLGMDTGINVTLGLPILRTSVDHGTAFDIAGKGMARETSLLAAIAVAEEFLNPAPASPFKV
ncbi:4-hydroxythreonine-4-phosphate dehydrogenase PdxA [Alicyclobacillaceae bacterium I2511]|nr:4-hydroxythreonine-4-phosphate dehydrogenase PdxA [Alicyclobacillaceae bacterium I2511]